MWPEALMTAWVTVAMLLTLAGLWAVACGLRDGLRRRWRAEGYEARRDEELEIVADVGNGATAHARILPAGIVAMSVANMPPRPPFQFTLTLPSAAAVQAALASALNEYGKARDADQPPEEAVPERD